MVDARPAPTLAVDLDTASDKLARHSARGHALLDDIDADVSAVARWYEIAPGIRGDIEVVQRLADAKAGAPAEFRSTCEAAEAVLAVCQSRDARDEARHRWQRAVSADVELIFGTDGYNRDLRAGGHLGGLDLLDSLGQDRRDIVICLDRLEGWRSNLPHMRRVADSRTIPSPRTSLETMKDEGLRVVARVLVFGAIVILPVLLVAWLLGVPFDPASLLQLLPFG